ncbi:hypothetical protein [Acinetobacter silvestris]|uniref:Uncharacterized protein n=1 Tax=Acinetobacter silvestris TaxID=1977882 RepID=A0A1Y3CKA9_9GAMM|nr:hypothetical protein [Acinetobacter silvestris]OTG66583.1 hypothetical protein B9T28_04865 [Acinetobacter silvestris]
MRVAFIGGGTSGDVEQSKEPMWQVERENTRKMQVLMEYRLSHGIPLGNYDVIETYNLMVMKINKEFKIFYVLEGMSKDDILEHLYSCWDKSDTIGYDFD